MSKHGYTLHIDDGVARFELDQPERANALSAGFWHAFPRDVAALADRGDLRAVIVSARGDHFCAGMDLEAFAGDILDPVSSSAR